MVAAVEARSITGSVTASATWNVIGTDAHLVESLESTTVYLPESRPKRISPEGLVLVRTGSVAISSPSYHLKVYPVKLTIGEPLYVEDDSIRPLYWVPASVGSQILLLNGVPVTTG